MALAETITWQSVLQQMPDCDCNVLCADETGTFEGYFDGIDWRDLDANEVPGVTHWAEMPKGPRA